MKDGTVVAATADSMTGVNADEVESVYFGGFPANMVKDTTVISKLETTKFGSTGMEKVDGIRYNRVNYTNPDGSREFVYYESDFIKWNVIGVNGNELLLITEDVIDFEPAKKDAKESTWSDSKLNSWLRSNFLSIAFSAKEKKLIKGTPVLLKESELTDEIKMGIAKCTDYARMGCNYGYASYLDPAPATWWLMPEGSGKYQEFSYVTGSNGISSSAISDAERHGLRPVIRINLKK